MAFSKLLDSCELRCKFASLFVPVLGARRNISSRAAGGFTFGLGETTGTFNGRTAEVFGARRSNFGEAVCIFTPGVRGSTDWSSDCIALDSLFFARENENHGCCNGEVVGI